tara:strand:- start:116 stop:520 length:405 start_codon:yes stop_codon:yes gene_type:complete
MANPRVHSKSSVRLWGGEIEDYLPLHNKMDCSKKYFSDNRHRTLTHNMFFIFEVMLPLFGEYITNSSGKVVSVKDICEYHILEDYGKKFIPNVSDFLSEMDIKPWMANGVGENPYSIKKNVSEEKKVLKRILID